jgi:hypothetical protein
VERPHGASAPASGPSWLVLPDRGHHPVHGWRVVSQPARGGDTPLRRAGKWYRTAASYVYTPDASFINNAFRAYSRTRRGEICVEGAGKCTF